MKLSGLKRLTLLAPLLLTTLSGCASTRGAGESVAPTKAGKAVVAIPDSCEKKIAGKISKGKLKIGEDPKTLTVRRGGIIDKLNARIEARDKCASTRQNAFGGGA